MTTPALWQGTRPPDRIRHSWRCTRRAPVVETVVADSTSRNRVVSQCTECGHDDLPERIRAEAERGGPTCTSSCHADAAPSTSPCAPPDPSPRRRVTRVEPSSELHDNEVTTTSSTNSISCSDPGDRGDIGDRGEGVPGGGQAVPPRPTQDPATGVSFHISPETNRRRS
jgi:hypothetical protein